MVTDFYNHDQNQASISWLLLQPNHDIIFCTLIISSSQFNKNWELKLQKKKNDIIYVRIVLWCEEKKNF